MSHKGSLRLRIRLPFAGDTGGEGLQPGVGKWQLIPVFLPEALADRILVGQSMTPPYGRK